MLLKYTSSDVPVMQIIMEHIIRGRGKRLRPVLLLLCGGLKLTGGSSLVRAAAAAELIHTASLVHDDVIDSSTRRRNKPSVNASWGNRSAVLAGDFLFARAFELITLCKNFELNKIFTAAISAMCEGEIEQLRHLFNLELTRQDYLQIIYRKTAVLMEACCGAGARLASLDAGAIRRLTAYGRKLGLAFQIADDILDYAGDPLITGKPAGKDLKEGVITLPLIFALRDDNFKLHLRKVIETGDFSLAGMEFSGRPLCLEGPLKLAKKEVAFLTREARASLKGFPTSPELEILEGLAEYVLFQVAEI